jgi:hypothetical protein
MHIHRDLLNCRGGYLTKCEFLLEGCKKYVQKNLADLNKSATAKVFVVIVVIVIVIFIDLFIKIIPLNNF